MNRYPVRLLGVVGILLLCIVQFSSAQSNEKPSHTFQSLFQNHQKFIAPDDKTPKITGFNTTKQTDKWIKRERRSRANTRLLQGVDRISIDLFDETSALVELVRVKKNKRGRTVWRGRVVGLNKSGVQSPADGSVTLVISGSSLVGNVRINDIVYEIESDQGGVENIREINPDAFPGDHSNDYYEADAGNMDEFQTSVQSSSASLSSPMVLMAPDSDIRILILYTQAVVANVEDVPAFIDLVIDETNQSFVNSQLDSVVQVSLASSAQVDYTELADHDDMLAEVASIDDGVLDDIHNLRIQNEADIVVLLHNQKEKTACGVAGPAIGSGYENGFAIVHQECASTFLSFAHELGHIAGSRHDSDTKLTPFAYGHGHTAPNVGFGTLMSRECKFPTCTRLNIWSDPEVEILNEFMGVAGFSNSARVWRERAAILANFHEDNNREQWFFDSTPVWSSPVVDENNTIYFAGRENNIFSLNADMSVNWQQDFNLLINADIAIEAGALYFRTYGTPISERVYAALDTATGEYLWSNSLLGQGGAPAVKSDGSSYVVDGAVLKYFSATGSLLNQVNLAALAHASPAIAADGSVYVADTSGQVYSFSANLDQTIWAYQLPASYPKKCLAIGGDGTLYMAAINGLLYAIDSNGNFKWEYNYGSGTQLYCPVIDINNNILIGSGNKIHAVTAEGTPLWASDTLGANITSTPAIADNGDILVGTRENVSVLNQNGKLLWSSPLGQNLYSSVVIANNGFAYIGDMLTSNGGLRAINLSGKKLANTAWPRLGGGFANVNRFQFEGIDNHAPIVTIQSPLDGVVFHSSDGAITLQASAADFEEGDLSNAVEWMSDLDGFISSPVVLSPGLHTITASIEDGGQLIASDSVDITIVEPFQIQQNFDSMPGVADGWSFYSSDDSLGRIAVQNSELIMDMNVDGNTNQNFYYNLNEAVLEVDLANAKNVVLSFQQSAYGDEQHEMPVQFYGHANADGVAISKDGTIWYALFDSSDLETNTQKQLYSINVDSVVEDIQQNYDADFSYSSNFQIKFQQYDNYAQPWDGRAWDDVMLNAELFYLDVSVDDISLTLLESEIGSEICTTLFFENLSASNISWSANSSNSLFRLPFGGDQKFIPGGGQDEVNLCVNTENLTLNIWDRLSSTVAVVDATNRIVSEHFISLLVTLDNGEIPYSMDFNTGLPGASEWTYYSSNTYGRIVESNGALVMDVSNSGPYNLNEAVLTLDLSSQQHLHLAFNQSETEDENDNMPASFSGHHNSDGVAISADGVIWYSVVPTEDLDVGAAGRNYSIDLDNEVARIRETYDEGFAYGPNFSIKFQQYDNYSRNSDGREWDNISLSYH